MYDEDDYEGPRARATARRAGSKTRGRHALKLLLRRLDWMQGTLVYWTGEPLPASAVGLAASVVQQRLRSQPAGAYAVRLGPGRQPASGYPFNQFVASLSPTVVAAVPVDLPLIARSLRRLLDVRRFPVLLPAFVGDVAAWTRHCDEALRRTRRLLDAIAAGDNSAIGQAALVLGKLAAPIDHDGPRVTRPAARSLRQDPSPRRRRRPGRSTPLSASLSASGVSTAAPSPELARQFAAWPADVLCGVVRLVGEEPLGSLSRRLPTANDVAVAAAVRDRLLFAPHTIAGFLDQLPSLVALSARIAEEPDRRLQAAASIQRSALESAVAHAGVSGNPVGYLGRIGSPKNLSVQRLLHYYSSEVAAALAVWFAPLPVPSAVSAPPPPGLTVDPVHFIRELLIADPIRQALLHPCSRGRAAPHWVRWKQVGTAGGLIVAGEKEPLTFETLPAAAAGALWTLTKRSRTTVPPGVVLSLGAIDVIGDAGDIGDWVEWCCHAWPIGSSGRVHGEAVLIAVQAAYAAPPEHRRATLKALNALAVPLLRHAASVRPTGDARPEHRLYRQVRTVVRAITAGISSDQLANYFAFERTDALDQVIRLAPDRVGRFSDWLDAWSERVAARVESVHDRSRLLALWGFNGAACTTWAYAYLLMGSNLLTRLMDTLLSCGLDEGQVQSSVRCLADFANNQSCSLQYAAALPADADLGSARAILAEAVPTLRSTVRRAVLQTPPRVEQAVLALKQCLDTARVAFGGEAAERPSAVAALASACAAEVRRRRSDSTFDGYLFSNSGHFETETLVAIARRRPDRIVALGLATLDLNWPQVEQIASAWRQVERIPTLAEALSVAASRENRTSRTLRLLARLGLALRLSGGDQFRAELIRMSAGPAPGTALPAELALRAAPLSSEQRVRLLELLHWRSDGSLPERIGETLERPTALARELAQLQATAGLKPAALRRRENLQRQLADRDAMVNWMRRDIDKNLPAATDDARLDRLEQRVAAAVASHFATVLSRPVPPPRDPREERNWDNALRLYFSVESNRALLRRLLTHELSGDRSWILKQQQNARFLAGAKARGIDVQAWLAPMSRLVESAAGPLRIEIETDPLHVLQMGNYFDTCLSEGEFNAFSTIANAVEVNKRVIYVYDHRRVVIGRKLIVMTREGALLGFSTYGRTPTKVRRPDNEDWQELKDLLDAFCRDLAARCGASLHPYTADTGPAELAEPKPLTLFAKWYNDGPEAFGARWLKGMSGPGARPPSRSRPSR